MYFNKNLKKSPLKNLFGDYDGEDDFNKAVTFVENKFRELNSGDQGRIFAHQTCATDIKSVEKVFKDMTEKLIELNIANFIKSGRE